LLLPIKFVTFIDNKYSFELSAEVSPTPLVGGTCDGRLQIEVGPDFPAGKRGARRLANCLHF
jgi:hypothetical protein